MGLTILWKLRKLRKLRHRRLPTGYANYAANYVFNYVSWWLRITGAGIADTERPVSLTTDAVAKGNHSSSCHIMGESWASNTDRNKTGIARSLSPPSTESRTSRAQRRATSGGCSALSVVTTGLTYLNWKVEKQLYESIGLWTNSKDDWGNTGNPSLADRIDCWVIDVTTGKKSPDERRPAKKAKKRPAKFYFERPYILLTTAYITAINYPDATPLQLPKCSSPIRRVSKSTHRAHEPKPKWYGREVGVADAGSRQRLGEGDEDCEIKTHGWLEGWWAYRVLDRAKESLSAEHECVDSVTAEDAPKTKTPGMRIAKVKETPARRRVETNQRVVSVPRRGDVLGRCMAVAVHALGSLDGRQTEGRGGRQGGEGSRAMVAATTPAEKNSNWPAASTVSKREERFPIREEVAFSCGRREDEREGLSRDREWLCTEGVRRAEGSYHMRSSGRGVRAGGRGGSYRYWSRRLSRPVSVQPRHRRGDRCSSSRTLPACLCAPSAPCQQKETELPSRATYVKYSALSLSPGGGGARARGWITYDTCAGNVTKRRRTPTQRLSAARARTRTERVSAPPTSGSVVYKAIVEPSNAVMSDAVARSRPRSRDANEDAGQRFVSFHCSTHVHTPPTPYAPLPRYDREYTRRARECRRVGGDREAYGREGRDGCAAGTEIPARTRSMTRNGGWTPHCRAGHRGEGGDGQGPAGGHLVVTATYSARIERQQGRGNEAGRDASKTAAPERLKGWTVAMCETQRGQERETRSFQGVAVTAFHPRNTKVLDENFAEEGCRSLRVGIKWQSEFEFPPHHRTQSTGPNRRFMC
ncbi:hypothetical protein FB451DRAFT_1519059 [Mycena latifolia]|nr:hypothetical protein FB451DRAFT_1519059 [Mycena latifolia]